MESTPTQSQDAGMIDDSWKAGEEQVQVIFYKILSDYMYHIM